MDISALVPIYILVLIGFVLVKTGYVPKDVVRPANLLVIKIFVPVLIFLVTFRISQAGNFHMRFILGYGLASLAVIALSIALLKMGFGFDLAKASLLSLGSAGSNSIFIGFPLVLLILPDLADASLGWVLIVENLLVIPLCLVLFDAFRADQRSPMQLLRGVFQNTIMLAILLGLCLPLIITSIWQPLEQALNMMRLATAGFSLVLVGGMLARSKLGGQLGSVFSVVFAKLVLHPLSTFLVFLALGITGNVATIGITYAAVSCFGVYANFCETAGEGEFGASVFFLSTLLAPVTISGWLAIAKIL